MSQTSNEKKRQLIVYSLIIIAVGFGLLMLFLLFFGPDKPSSTSRLAPARSETVTGQAGGEGSAEYNDKLRKHDDQKAEAALQKGESFVPTPVGQKKPVVVKKKDTPPPASPPVAPVRPMQVRAPAANDAMLKRMLEDLANLDNRLSSSVYGDGQIVYVRDFSEKSGVVTDAAEKTSIIAPAQSFVAIKPGDMLYAIIDTGVNSDVPSAVLATVSAGEYRNAKLLGSFRRHDERLVLAFNRAVLPSGENIQLEAYAVDPETSQASVASSVDTHFLSRWGGLIASSFLEGLGTAKRFSGASSTVYGYGGNATDQMVWNSYSPEDQAWIAAGKVGEKAAKIFEKGFERPPTVYLESGTPVGVLVLNIKE